MYGTRLRVWTYFYVSDPGRLYWLSGTVCDRRSRFGTSDKSTLVT